MISSKIKPLIGRVVGVWSVVFALIIAVWVFVTPLFDGKTHAALLKSLGLVFALAQFFLGLVLSKVEDLKNRTEGLTSEELEEFLSKIRFHKGRIFWACLSAYLGAATAAVCGVLVQESIVPSVDLLLWGYAGLCLSLPASMFSVYLYVVADRYADQNAVKARREQESSEQLRKLNTTLPYDFENDPHFKEREKIIPMHRKKS